MQLIQDKKAISNGHDGPESTIVVGGGLAGLAAAAYLAKGGKRVTVFEKASALGGRAASQNHDGFVFNLGAHALYEKSAAANVLAELGVHYTTGSPVGIRAIANGGNYLAPVDTTSLLRTRLIGPRAKLEAARLLLKLQMADPHAHARETLAEWLDREVHLPEVRRIME